MPGRTCGSSGLVPEVGTSGKVMGVGLQAVGQAVPRRREGRRKGKGRVKLFLFLCVIVFLRSEREREI